MSCYCASKSEGERSAFGFDWTDFLAGVGSNIVASDWSCDDDGLTIGASTFDADGLVTSVWLSGGHANTVYHVTNTVTLANSGIEVSTIELHLLED